MQQRVKSTPVAGIQQKKGFFALICWFYGIVKNMLFRQRSWTDSILPHFANQKNVFLRLRKSWMRGVRN